MRLVLADEHGIVRESLCALFEKRRDMKVVAHTENGETAIDLVRQLLPDVVIVGIRMQRLGGVETTRLITANFPEVKVIALSMHSEMRFVAGMLEAGTAGYLPKECAFDELAHAILTVAAGERYLSPKIVSEALTDYLNAVSHNSGTVLPSLTCREYAVLSSIAEGKPLKRIAAETCVSVKTIAADRRKIMEKLGLYSVAELTRYALRNGLTSLW